MTTKTTWLKRGRMLTGLVWIPLILLGSGNNHASGQQSTPPSCYTLCADEANLPEGICEVVKPRTDCESTEDSSSTTSSDSTELPTISFIEVYQIPGSGPRQYGLRFSWTGPSIVADNGSIVTYKVMMKGSANEPKCQTFDIIHSTVHPQPAIHHCIPSLKNAEVMNITLTQMTTNSSVKYIIKTPSNLTSTIDPSSLTDWKTIIAVAANPTTTSLIGVFQLAPSSLNISGYDIDVLESKSQRSIHRRELNITIKRDATFTVTQTDGIEKRESYVVHVYPLDPGCDIHCFLSKSESILIPAPGNVAPPSSTTASTTPRPASSPLPPSTGPTTTEDGSVIVQPAGKRRLYEKSVMIILGTVFGVIGTAIVVGVFFFYWYRRSRRRQAGNFPMQRFGHRRDSDSSIGMEHAYKHQQPMVLIVYSYDCPAHEKVILKFAEYLSQAGNCDVALDVNEQDVIQEQGVHNWYQDKIEISQYILVICSTGARFKCARNRQFRLKHDHSVPDVFSWTVDIVAEKMRMARNSGDSTDRFIIGYFDHAGESDIPPKLELAQQYVLMKDVFALYCHIHGLKQETAQHDDGAVHNGLTPDTYFKTEIGKELQEVLESAKQFFKDNPDWLGQILEPVTPVTTKMSKTKEIPPSLPARNEGDPEVSTDQTDGESRLKRQTSQSPSVTSEEDTFLEERKKKREKDKRKHIDKVPLMKARMDPPEEPTDSPRTNHSQVTSNSSSIASTSPLIQGHPVNKIGSPPNTSAPNIGSNGFSKTNGSQEDVELEIDDDFEEEDLDKEVDAIKNFDAHHEGQWWNTGTDSHNDSRDSILDIELGGYTPPQDYISLASLHESLSSPSVTSLGLESGSLPSSPVKNHVALDIPGSPCNHVQAVDAVCV